MALDLMALAWLSELYGIRSDVSVNWNSADTRRIVEKVVATNAGFNELKASVTDH